MTNQPNAKIGCQCNKHGTPCWVNVNLVDGMCEYCAKGCYAPCPNDSHHAHVTHIDVPASQCPDRTPVTF